MNYHVKVKRSAAKALKKIPKADQKRIADKIDSLAEDLPNPDTTKMKGNNPFHRIRVGEYRIIYEIQEDVLLILVVKIGHRKDIYRNLPNSMNTGCITYMTDMSRKPSDP